MPTFNVGITVYNDNELQRGSTTRHRILFSFPIEQSKVKFNIIFDRPLLGPLKGDRDTNHYIPIFTAGIKVNHDNEPFWGSTTRHRILFSFPIEESKVRFNRIFDRPLSDPLKWIVTAMTIYQYLQLE